ncbi:MAG: TonB-dependent receptor plug domain-containing protein, partial [Bacteroidota bacterium]
MKKFILLAILIPSAIFAIAQKTITGTVLDENSSAPLQGATVMAKESKVTTQTDQNGLFSIKITGTEKKLVISYTGFEPKEVPADALKAITIRLEKSGFLNEVSVIGSRNLIRTKVETPAPIDIIPVNRIINQVGQIDINQLLTYVAPSFQSSRQTVSDGTDHVDPAQLRGLGSDQVLVLINGKRRHQSALVNVNGTVNRGQTGTDLSSIPVTAVERIEVLRDGAAAQYGSDAIAGVINIVLKKNANGLSGMVSYGENSTSYPKDYALNKIAGKNSNEKTNVTDGANFQAALNYGISLNKKGFLNLTGEYIKRDLTNRTGTYTDQIYPSAGGKVKDDSIMAARGTNRNNFDMRIGNSKMTGGSLMLNSQYNFTDKWKLQLFGGYSK